MKRILFYVLFFFFAAANVYGISPAKEYKFKPSDIKLNYDEYKVGGSDGQCMNVWYMPSRVKNKKNICILIVGSDSGNMGYSLPYVTGLLANGFDVVSFDYRGFGESSAFKHSSKKLYHKEYVDDFVSVLSWVKREKKPARVGCMAFSMGSIICNLGKSKEGFDFLVSEGFITSPQKLVARIQKGKDKKVVLPLLERSYEKEMDAYKIPMLIFASSTEKITTLEDAKTFAAKAANRKIIAHDGGHLAGARTIGVKEYIGLITDFLK